MTSVKKILLTMPVVLTGMMSIAIADNHKSSGEELCNTIIDGDGESVRIGDGDVLRSDETEPCPVVEEVAEEVEEVEEVVVVEQKVFITIDGDVAFGFDKSDIKPEYRTELDGIAAALKNSDHNLFSVVGHTDSTGSDDYNQSLSERRALSVVEYMIGTGLEPAFFVAEGKGETEPLVSNDTPEGRARNRRVEIHSVSD